MNPVCNEIYTAYYKSEIGIVEIKGSETGITALNFVDTEIKIPGGIPQCLREAAQQINEYFRGKRRDFKLKLQIEGTEFQRKVWRQLMKVPFGKTVSYKDIAVGIHNSGAVRAVGRANQINNIAIIIPCHRVIGSNGKLIGYSGGLQRKEWLLQHEQKLT